MLKKAYYSIIIVLAAMQICFAANEDKNPLLVSEPDKTGNVYRQKLETLITEEPGPAQQLEAYFRFLPSSGVSSMPGTVEVIESEAEYSYDFKLFDQLPIQFSTNVQYIDINDTVEVPLPSHLTGVSMGWQATVPFFSLEKTYFRLRLIPSFYSDSWNFRSSNFRLPVHAFAIYQPNDQWTFVGGIAIYPDYDSVYNPIIGFIYKPNDKLTFNIIPIRPVITYSLNKKLDLFTAFDMVDDEYEVTRNGQKNVILRYKEMHMGAGFKYKINQFVTASFSAGEVFSRMFKYRDYNGKVVVQSGVYTEFRVEMAI